MTWNCPSCGASNEPHAIFCSSCGAMRTKAPARESVAPVADEPLPEPGPPEFRGTVTNFVLWWTGATVGGVMISWFLDLALSNVALQRAYQSLGPLAGMTVSTISYALMSGFLIGALQAGTLSRCFGRPGWARWTWATLAGSLGGSLAWIFMFTSPLSQRLESQLIIGIHAGIVTGGLAGFLQSRALARNLGRGSWRSWVLISAGAHTLANIAGSLLLQGTNKAYVGGGLFEWYVGGLAYSLLDGSLLALLTGIPLGRGFRRRCAPPPGTVRSP